MNLCASFDVYFSFKTFSHQSHEYLSTEFFFFLIKGKDSFWGSSLNDISLYLKQKILGLTARCLILYALVRALHSPLSCKVLYTLRQREFTQKDLEKNNGKWYNAMAILSDNDKQANCDLKSSFSTNLTKKSPDL